MTPPKPQGLSGSILDSQVTLQNTSLTSLRWISNDAVPSLRLSAGSLNTGRKQVDSDLAEITEQP